MAPALVEHSAAKERNSSTTKYLENFTCLPPIVLVDNMKRIESSSLLKNKLLKPSVLFTEKENTFVPSSSITTSQTSAAQTTKLSSLNNNSNTHSPSSDSVTVECNNTSDSKLNTFERKSDLPDYKFLVSAGSCKTAESRAEQPVAKLNQVYLTKIVKQKEEAVQSKFYNMHKTMFQLDSSLHKLRKRHFNGHVACNIKFPESDISINSKSESTIKNVKELNKKDKNFKNSDPLCFGIRKQKLVDSNLHLGKVYDSVKCVEDEDTDFEEDFDYRLRIPISRGKRKTENPPPPSDALHLWKKKRCKVGFQCSWLSLQIHSLDKKIESLQQIHEKLKIERRISRKLNAEPPIKNDPDVVGPQNGVINSSLSPDDAGYFGSTRTRSIPTTWTHKYIRKSPIPQSKWNYKCRSLPVINSCNLCERQSVNEHSVRFNHNLAPELDPSYHGSLSFESDTPLSFLLEETLRKQKINTQVTITKSTKKKKKLKLKDLNLPSTNVEKSTKHPAVNKTVRARNERTDEPSRKRPLHSERDSAGRFKKIRKFSESFSCDSSKPSTPTNELVSPLSQSLNSSGLFSSSLNRNKKKLSSSGDYDINNIVIPYSIASSTRVEKIQYKEIPTPGWRSVDSEAANRDSDEEREFTDDEMIAERHARCEVLERKRFTDFFQLSMNRRRVPRCSEGPNSEPPSPVVVDESQKFNSGTPAESPTTTPKNQFCNLTSCLEDEREVPWPLRNFPLTKKEFEGMDATCELSHVSSHDERTLESLKQVSQKLMATVSQSSPLVSASPLTSPATPDEMNTNWTVKVLDGQPLDVVTSEKQRKGIVLKLAKK